LVAANDPIYLSTFALDGFRPQLSCPVNLPTVSAPTINTARPFINTNVGLWRVSDNLPGVNYRRKQFDRVGILSVSASPSSAAQSSLCNWDAKANPKDSSGGQIAHKFALDSRLVHRPRAQSLRASAPSKRFPSISSIYSIAYHY
jgi:hypothetical protein